jgi:hypothetical protein
MSAATLKIIGLEGVAKGVVVQAQFNPKEVSIDKSVPWQLRGRRGSGGLQYTGGEPRTMTFELMFDLVASRGAVTEALDRVDRLSDADPALGRPPRVAVICGIEGEAGVLPKFESVIESIVVRYTVFDADGRPGQATVGLRFKEVRDLPAEKAPRG